jgi:GT2 family glycosyltransferase
MPSRVAVAVVIVNYNGGALVEDAVRSALAQTAPDVRVVVVDNASTDDSPARLRRWRGQVELIESPTNTGFAGGNNLAFAAVPEAMHYALLNPDAVAAPTWLERSLACAAAHPAAAMIAPKIVNAADEAVLDNAGHLMFLDGTVRGRGRNQPAAAAAFDTARQIFIASGCAVLLRGDAVRELGGFDEDFFCYCDDVELSLRLNWAGYEGWYCPEARVSHHFSASASSKFSPFKAYQVERNRYWVVAKCFPLPLVPVAFAGLLARYAASAVASARGRGPGARLLDDSKPRDVLATLARAHRDGLRDLPRMLAAGRRLAAHRRISTREFLARWRRSYLPLAQVATVE